MNCYSQADSAIQIQKNYPSLSLNVMDGKILPTTDFVRGDNMEGLPLAKYLCYSLKLLWQNPGYKEWQKVYRAPNYGVGISIADFFDLKEIGYPVSVYGVLGIPVKRWHKLELYSEFQFGLAGNWKHYDSVSNPKNLVVGGLLTAHLNIGLYAFYQLSKQLDLGAGLSFIHFSNGGFERPNQGFNIYSPSLELKYHFRYRPEFAAVRTAGRSERSNDLYFMLGYGDYQLNNHELDSNYFAVGGVSAIC